MPRSSTLCIGFGLTCAFTQATRSNVQIAIRNSPRFVTCASICALIQAKGLSSIFFFHVLYTKYVQVSMKIYNLRVIRCEMSNCNKAFTSSQHLRNHFSSHNCKNFAIHFFLTKSFFSSIIMFDQKAEKPFKCSKDFCDKQFKSNIGLANHLKNRHKLIRPVNLCLNYFLYSTD